MLCCKRRKAKTSLVTLQLREVVNIEVVILVVRKPGQDLAFNDAAHRLHFSASPTGRMEELQVMRALGMSIDLSAPSCGRNAGSPPASLRRTGWAYPPQSS